MPRIVRPKKPDAPVADAPAASSAVGLYARLLADQHDRYENPRRVDPRWSRSHDDGAGGVCTPGEYSHKLRGFVPPCDHHPPYWACGVDGDLYEALLAGRPVIVADDELPRDVVDVAPGRRPRWFQVTPDDRVSEVAAPDPRVRYSMSPYL